MCKSDQLESGTPYCVTVRAVFNNDYKLTGKPFVKTQTCANKPKAGQSFKQIYYDENDQDRFAICLTKYYDGPISPAKNLWVPKFWCLIGNKNLVKVLRAKSLNQIKDDLKWQWSYNEERKLINHNNNGRFMYKNKAGRIKLLPNHLSTINNFGSQNKCSFSVIDHCANNLCQNGAVCVNGQESSFCRCKSGFEGIHCEIEIDKNDCIENPCQNSGRCIDEIDGYTCFCPAGYDGDHCENNIDDCLSNHCQNNSTCIDGVNSYFCQCDTGWEGQFCTSNIDDCSVNPCQNHTCQT